MSSAISATDAVVTLLTKTCPEAHYQQALKGEGDCDLSFKWAAVVPPKTQICDLSTIVVAKAIFGFDAPCRKLQHMLYSAILVPLRLTGYREVKTIAISNTIFCDPKYRIEMNCNKEDFERSFACITNNADSLHNTLKKELLKVEDIPSICLKSNEVVFASFEQQIRLKMRTVSEKTKSLFFIAIHSGTNQSTRANVWHSFTIEVLSSETLRLYSSWYRGKELHSRTIHKEAIDTFITDLRTLVLYKNREEELADNIVEKCFEMKDKLPPYYSYSKVYDKERDVLTGRMFSYCSEDFEQKEVQERFAQYLNGRAKELWQSTMKKQVSQDATLRAHYSQLCQFASKPAIAKGL